MKIWGAFKTSSIHRGFNLKDDGIHVFLNYQKVGFFTDNQSAQKCIDKLLAEAPVDLSEFQEYLKIK